MEALFWIAAGLVIYAYGGYGVCVAALGRLRPRPAQTAAITPAVSVIIPCYNEASCIRRKLENTLALDYPSDRLEILVVSSGSNDGTEEVARQYAARGVSCLVQPVREGKEAALRLAAREARGEVLVFTDANAELNREAIRALVRWFADPAVGCVAGEKRVRGPAAGSAGAGVGEGMYWQYESWMKRLDSLVGSTMGAAGEVMAVRALLATFPNTDSIIEDFVLSMRIAAAGYRVVYEPGAVASEEAPMRLSDLFERRARNAAGGFRALWRLRRLLDPRRGLLWWQYVSHRALRWALVPFLLPLLVAVNAALARGSELYRATLAAQLAFYGLAAAGWRLQGTRLGSARLVCYPFFLCFVNAAAIAGCLRLLTGRQTAIWKRTRA